MRIIIAPLVCLLMTACATHSTIVAPQPVIRRIAIIPASNPRWYSFDNAAPPIGGYPFQYWVNKFDSKGKARAFNEKMRSPPLDLGSNFTEEIATALRDQGFTVEILADIVRATDDPDSVDYDKIHTEADAIVHLTIWEVGVYSSGYSLYYIPRVNASAKIWVNGQEDSLYRDDIYYGVDARKGKTWAIVPDPKFSYRTFEAVMSNLDDVRSAFAIGTLEISRAMSERLGNAAIFESGRNGSCEVADRGNAPGRFAAGSTAGYA